ncbi:MAG: glycosyl hydrolase, partial [Cycloclasticus sp.]|nr:glycosyl hydrolase [Cycloclasticus sp.]
MSKIGKGLPYLSSILLSLIMATVAIADGQKNLVEQEFHRFWPDNLYAVDFVNDKTGFIAGYSGSLFRTQDGGETWDGIYLGVSELIRHVSFVDEKTGWAVGHQGSILHTSDGGTTWETQKKDEGIYLRDISFADKNNGWAVGHAAKIWHTSDGGKNWDSQSLTGFGGRDLPRLHSVVAKDANSAILVGEFGVVAHTENAGKLWMVSYNPHKNTILSVAKNDQGAVAVGLDGGIFNIALASDEQRAEVKAIEEKRLAKIEAKAIKKAQRRKKVYVPKVVEPLPETEIDYYITKIDSGTKEHIYDVSETPNGDA